YMIAVGTLIFAYNLLRSLKRGRRAGPNPWNAPTLEWAIPSPPPEYNFRELPVVRSRMPLWEKDPVLDAGIPHGRHEEDTSHVTLAGAEVGEQDWPDDESKMSAHDLGIHLPPPSFFPILLALSIAVFFGGFMLHWGLSLAGAVAVLLLAYGFAFEPGHSGH